MFERGYLQIGTFGNAPIRIHILTPLGWLFFTRGHFTIPGFLGLFILVLIHELGHAYAVKWSGAQVRSVDVHPLGGVCQWNGQVSELDRAWIASAGVAAQMVVWICAKAFFVWRGAYVNDFTLELLYALTWWNLYMAAFNLIPIPPFDGAEAWKLIPLLTKGTSNQRKQKKLRMRVDELQRQLDEMEGKSPNDKSENDPQRWLN